MLLDILDLKIIYPFLDLVDMIRLSMISKNVINWNLYFLTSFGYQPLQPVSKKMLYHAKKVEMDFEKISYQNYRYVKNRVTKYHSKLNPKQKWLDWIFKFACQVRKKEWYYIYKHGLVLKDLYYYEMEILSELSAKQCISFGFATREYFDIISNNKLLIGWTNQSIGWHSDDGNIFWQNSKYPSVTFKKNDIVGCGYDYETSDVFYTKNGIEVFRMYVPFKNSIIGCIAIDDYEVLYDLNFGKKKFVYDLY